jgi:hypothetical protein
MNVELFLAVEAAIPPDHPASILAIPLGILFFVGSIYLLLWSNYGAKKALAITGVGWAGFSMLLGVFWWFGAPGIPAGLGINHLPGQATDHYVDRWYGFEEGSERAQFFPSHTNVEAFAPPHEYLGLPPQDDVERPDLAWTNLVSLAGEAEMLMLDQFLPVDNDGVAQIGAERRAAFEEEVAENIPEEAARRAPTFFTADAVGDVRLLDDAETGVKLATAEFQAFANFVDEEGIPLEPVPVGPTVNWFAFYDPGMVWVPSALWTGISLLIFLLSLAWLDRMEMREKRRAAEEVEEPERLAVPIAQ